jgi:hypothetical protein
LLRAGDDYRQHERAAIVNESRELPGFWAFFWSIYVAGAFGSIAVGVVGGASGGGSSLASLAIPLLVGTVIGAFIFQWVLMQFSERSIGVTDAAVLVFVGMLTTLAFRVVVGITMLRSARPSQAGLLTTGLLVSWGAWVVGALASYQVFRLLFAPARPPTNQGLPAPRPVQRSRSRPGAATPTLLLWASVLMLLGALVFFVLAARHAFA